MLICEDKKKIRVEKICTDKAEKLPNWDKMKNIGSMGNVFNGYSSVT